jgi:hypothetical protein
MLAESNKSNEKILIIDNIKMEQMEPEEEDEKYTTVEKIIYILKGISSIISGIIHIFGYYSIQVLGFSIAYLISFRRYYNNDLDYSHAYCLFPLVNLVLCMTIPLSGIIEDKFGGKTTIFLSNFILCISFLFLYYSKSIYVDYCLMCLNGFGIGIGINITKKNACSFFMNYKCLILGTINLIPNILSFFLMYYNELDILNYANEPPLVEYTYYRKKVFINYKKLIISEIKILIYTSIGSILLYFQNNPKETIKFGFNQKTENTKSENINEASYNIKVIEKKKKKSKKGKIIKALYNNRTIRLIFLVLLFTPKINLIHNTIKMDITLYFMYGIAYYLAGAASSLLFTIIGDCLQFRIFFAFMCIISTVSSLILVNYIEEGFVVAFETVFVSFIFNGFNIIFDSHIMKVYGRDNYSHINGIVRSSGGLSEILAIFFKFGLKWDSLGFKIAYFATGLLSLLSLIIGIFEADDIFDYDY